jgi:uncharacterized pyridoxamine 5'-phosphate oxidase family protein
MEQILQFLNECGVFYLATTEKNQPRVRPFGAVMEFEGKLYICTNNTKKVYAQMLENPFVELSGTIDGRWLRLEGKVAVDPRKEAKLAMLKACPSLNNFYSAEDNIFEVLYFTEGKATFYSYTSDPVEIPLA